MADEFKKILVVDDEEDILIEARDILEKRGFTVFTALESESSLDIFRKEKPPICILDVHMPKSAMDGIRILEEIRKLDKNCYCIMLSRVDEQDKIEAARSLGANRYTLKPIDYPELLELVNDAVKALESRGVPNG
ncbi:MAG: response regulator [Candidatus Omnitrophota bacterium]|nr:response regulator [Candidatus Omnitrophota bacterium]